MKKGVLNIRHYDEQSYADRQRVSIKKEKNPIQHKRLLH